MTPKDLKELAITMREMGITSYKDGDVNIELGPEPYVAPPPLPEDLKTKAMQMADLLNLDNHQLLDQLFPPISES